MGRIRTMAAAVAVAGMVLGSGASVQANDDQLASGAVVHAGGAVAHENDNQFASDFGMGLGAAGANLIYMPTKIVYAMLGGLTGGLAYGLTGLNMDTARKVWDPSMGGTYVVTPTMLRGEDRVMFSGTTEPRATEVASSGAPQLAPSAPPPVVEEGSNEPYKGY